MRHKKIFSTQPTMTIEQVATMEKAIIAKNIRQHKANLYAFTCINMLILVISLVCAGLYLSFGSRLVSFLALLIIAASSLYAQAIVCFLKKKWVAGTVFMTFFITTLMSLLTKVYI